MTFARWPFATWLIIWSSLAYVGPANALAGEQSPAAPVAEAIPDIQGLWITLLESIPPDDPLRQGARSPWYLSVADAEQSISDPPPAVIARVAIPGIQVLPGSFSPFSGAPQTGVAMPPLIFIHWPAELADGRYEVMYEYYLGRNEGPRLMRAIVMHDVAGWHVFSRGPYPGPDDRIAPPIM